MFVIFVCFYSTPTFMFDCNRHPRHLMITYTTGTSITPKSTAATITESEYGGLGVVGFLVNQGEVMGTGPVHSLSVKITINLDRE
jgi:hypothetical protein